MMSLLDSQKGGNLFLIVVGFQLKKQKKLAFGENNFSQNMSGCQKSGTVLVNGKLWACTTQSRPNPV